MFPPTPNHELDSSVSTSDTDLPSKLMEKLKLSSDRVNNHRQTHLATVCQHNEELQSLCDAVQIVSINGEDLSLASLVAVAWYVT